MDWLSVIQTIATLAPLGFTFLFGIGTGSFINVVVARMPFEKSIIWPSSHCFSCLKPIAAKHNVPLLGYLLLRGRCAKCGATFSSRYFWIELITGVSFSLLYYIDVLTQTTGGPAWLKPWFDMPGMRHPFLLANDYTPIINGWCVWFAHASLFSLLLASSLIDAEHRIIPTTITYPGTLLGILCSVLMPWPWPTDPGLVPVLTNPDHWYMPQYEGNIFHGVQLWPFVGPPPSWASAGSWQLGLLNSLIGAAVGMMIGRGLKVLYESARGIEALGLGDADLLMMIGAFLGWQVALIALPFGAVCSLVFAIPRAIFQLVTKRPFDPALPFGPGIAIAAGLIWLAWPKFNESFRMTFDMLTTGIALGVVALGLGACGLFLRGR